MNLSTPNLPYDYAQARQRLIAGIQAYVQAAKVPGYEFRKIEAISDEGKGQEMFPGGTIETGSVTITYRFETVIEPIKAFEVVCKIDHGSDWSPGYTIHSPGNAGTTGHGIFPAWDWVKLLNSATSTFDYIHKKVAVQS